MDSKKQLEDNLENSNRKFLQENLTQEVSFSKKENQNDLKKLITKVDNRVKTKVNYATN
jgi:hypothetical protein